MPTSKYLTTHISNDSHLDRNRWGQAIETLAASIASGDTIIREEILLELQQTINEYEKRLENLLGEYEDVAPNYAPSSDHYQKSLKILKQNITNLFSELTALRELAIATFNRISTERNSLHKKLANVSGKVRSLGLYGLNEFIGRYIGESFTSLGSFNVDSLANDNALHIDLDSGLATLPLVNSETILFESISVDASYSNGLPGNRSDNDVVFNYNNSFNIVDGEPNTWWEYELVGSTSNQINGVRLGLILSLSEIELINQVSISMVNLGTLAEPEIFSVEGSLDNSEWFDLTEYMPLAKYLNEERSDILSISKSNSIRTNTVNIYTLPTSIQYLRIRMGQDEPIRIDSINDPTKTLFRYALGIRDITVSRNEYASSGKLKTRPFSVRPPVNTVLAFGAVTNLNSQLYSMDFSLSFGNNQYIPFQLASESELVANEVINTSSFGLSPENINEIGFQINMQRNEELFNEILLKETVQQFLSKDETFVIDLNRSPVVFSTSIKPIEDSITLIESPIYRVGNKFTLGNTSKSYDSGTNTFIDLPLKLRNLEIDDEGFIFNNFEVYVNDTLWTQVSNLDKSGINDEHYTLVNSDEFPFTRVKFGNSGGTGLHRAAPGSFGGKSLPDNAVVKARVIPEVLVFNYDGQNYNASFKVPCDGNKEAITIESQTEKIKVENLFIPAGVSSFMLQPLIDNSEAIIFKQYFTSGTQTPSLTTYKNEVSFVDGVTELKNNGDYSIDIENGILYSFSPSPTDRITTVSFYYFNRHTLNESEFTLVQDNGKFIGVSIHEDNFRSTQFTETLGATRDVSSSFDINNLSAPQFYPNIVNNYTAGDMVIYLSHGGIVPGTLEVPSDMFGIGKINEVEFVDGITEFLPGNVSFSTSSSGKYSVDYKRGIIYLSEAVSTGQEIKYISALYRASYDVGNYIDKFTINGSRIEMRTNNLTGYSNGKIRVVYDYSPIDSNNDSNVARYYSPVIRDIQIRYS